MASLGLQSNLCGSGRMMTGRGNGMVQSLPHQPVDTNSKYKHMAKWVMINNTKYTLYTTFFCFPVMFLTFYCKNGQVAYHIMHEKGNEIRP